ncbi:MAG: hypothetical protein RL077_1451 [Verrucomicrobiota bacterium]|jgi:hypothetical protein
MSREYAEAASYRRRETGPRKASGAAGGLAKRRVPEFAIWPSRARVAVQGQDLRFGEAVRPGLVVVDGRGKRAGAFEDRDRPVTFLFKFWVKNPRGGWLAGGAAVVTRSWTGLAEVRWVLPVNLPAPPTQTLGQRRIL